MRKQRPTDKPSLRLPRHILTLPTARLHVHSINVRKAFYSSRFELTAQQDNSASGGHPSVLSEALRQPPVCGLNIPR
jgi:hypothetical protein